MGQGANWWRLAFSAFCEEDAAPDELHEPRACHHTGPDGPPAGADCLRSIHVKYQRRHGNEEKLEAQRADAEKSYLGTKPDDFSARVIWAGEGVDLVRIRRLPRS